MNRKTLFPSIVIAFALVTAPSSRAAEKHTITLAGGETIEGLVLPLSDCAFLVQNGDRSIEIPADGIVKVDGSPDLSPLLRSGEGPLLRDDILEVIREDRSVILHSARSVENRSRTIVDHLSWGIAPHEEPLIPEWQVFDPFGNELVMTVNPPDENGRRQARATLVRPVLPGETIRCSDRIVFHDRISEDENAFLYRHRGDYPEARLVTKMILLPPGAEVIVATPEPLRRFDFEGAPCLVWRRFFAEGEVYPIEVRYRLKD